MAFLRSVAQVGTAVRRAGSMRFQSTIKPSQSSLPAGLQHINELRFDDTTLASLVDEQTYTAFHNAVKTGTEVPKNASTNIARAMMRWAMDRGATNFSHQFYPLRSMDVGGKHDTFIDLDFGSKKPLKGIINDFSASKLWMSETDGSSFPNGGLRATHTAAAYMIADRTSPPYIKGDTLYIPSAFVTWNGHAIDHKTGLLRSQEAVTNESTRLLHHLGFTDVEEVYAQVGWEQEFFAVPRELVIQRPDLMDGGRTVCGALPSRGQQLSDHYFGKINPRVKAFFEELNSELLQRGVSMCVYHNEVAPGQHEMSPIFALTNVAADQNILTVNLMHELSLKHGLVALQHEKPFRGINGSGKHCNWGLNSNTGLNLYASGKNEQEQQSFITFVAALMYAVKRYPEAFRASVATSGNDHRLGADEAPPAIFSIYTGTDLGDHLNNIVNGGELAGYTGGRYGDKMIPTGSRATGPVGGATEDRNRTAPLPFCGNRFEFRAVGSAQNIGLPMAVMNTAVAEGAAVISDLIESGKSVRDAVAEVIKSSKDVVFNGDGYSSEWHQEAENERNLPNLRNTVESFKTWTCEKNLDLFAKHKVFSSDEMHALKSVNFQRYSDDIEIEVNTMINMMNQGVLPACAADLKAYEGTNLSGNRPAVYEKLASETAALQKVSDAWPTDNEEEAAEYALSVAKPALEQARKAHDAAEVLIDGALYPYPTYHDMLYPHQQESD